MFSVSAVTRETSSRKSRSSARSRNVMEALRGVAIGALTRGLLNDLYARAGADARGSRGNHLAQIGERANSARGFHTDIRTDGRTHQRDIFDLGATRAESS